MSDWNPAEMLGNKPKPLGISLYKELITNNILVLEIDNKGILVEKIFLDKDAMQDLQFTESFTQMSYKKKSFVYDFLSSIRQKINDPLGKKKIKSKK